MTLYKVTLTGFDPVYSVAKDPNSAYEFVREHLDSENVRFQCDRKLESVEVVADQESYMDSHAEKIPKLFI